MTHPAAPTEPFIYSDVDGGSLTLHANGHDDDGNPVVYVIAEQIGSPQPVRITIRTKDAARVADALRAAASLPAA